MATLSVGGTTVFDGATLQSGVTVASGTTFPAGHVINLATNTSSTRVVYGGSDGSTHTALLPAFNYNKTVAGSTLYVHSSIPAYGCSAGGMDTGFKYGNSAVVNCGNFSYSGEAYCVMIIVAGMLAGHTTTGSQSVVIGCSAAAGGTHKPANIICPNVNEDSRLTQKVATTIIYEIMQ